MTGCEVGPALWRAPGFIAGAAPRTSRPRVWLESLGFAERDHGWRMGEDGSTALDGGDLPVICSGGVLSSNPIGASGMIRFAEAALQVRGLAGDHQVDGARRTLGHAYGGGAQYFAMWIVGADKP